jgi:hypothetical protein
MRVTTSYLLFWWRLIWWQQSSIQWSQNVKVIRLLKRWEMLQIWPILLAMTSWTRSSPLQKCTHKVDLNKVNRRKRRPNVNLILHRPFQGSQKPMEGLWEMLRLKIRPILPTMTDWTRSSPLQKCKCKVDLNKVNWRKRRPKSKPNFTSTIPRESKANGAIALTVETGAAGGKEVVDVCASTGGKEVVNLCSSDDEDHNDYHVLLKSTTNCSWGYAESKQCELRLAWKLLLIAHLEDLRWQSHIVLVALDVANAAEDLIPVLAG